MSTNPNTGIPRGYLYINQLKSYIMLSFTKFIGTVLIFFGLVLLMSCFESIAETFWDTIFLALNGVFFCLIGTACWLWCEPIDGDDED